LAYTSGPNIVVGRDSPAPDTPGGRQLIAHELAHVVQQATGAAAGIQRKPQRHGGTDYRFDSGHITAADLNDPDITERLRSMRRPELRVYRTFVADPFVQRFIDSLLALPPPPTQEYETVWFKPNQQNMEDVSKRSYWEQRTRRVWNAFPSAGRTNAEERDAVYAALWKLRPDP